MSGVDFVADGHPGKSAMHIRSCQRNLLDLVQTMIVLKDNDLSRSRNSRPSHCHTPLVYRSVHTKNHRVSAIYRHLLFDNLVFSIDYHRT